MEKGPKMIPQREHRIQLMILSRRLMQKLFRKIINGSPTCVMIILIVGSDHIETIPQTHCLTDMYFSINFKLLDFISQLRRTVEN